MKSKKRSNNRRDRPASSKRRGSRSIRWIVFAMAIAIAAAAALWWSGGNRQDDTSTLKSFESTEKLVGRWQRTDAGYEIDIRHVDRNGTVEAVYLNPNPIHVSQARVSDADGPLELFIELMDVGYPGATYNLRYSPEHDALVGLYFQPTAAQTFEVAFERK